MKLGHSHTLPRLLTQSFARNIWLYNFGKVVCNICGQQFTKLIFVWLTIFSVELCYKVADMQVQGHCQSSGCSWKKMVLDVIKHHEVITRLMVSRPKVWLYWMRWEDYVGDCIVHVHNCASREKEKLLILMQKQENR
jgi:hypothetical protein